jgi:hypothetical protein
MAETVDEFDALLHKKIKALQNIQTQWVEVISVDWDAKTCEVQGLSDELPFHDVSLGTGSFYIRPKQGCTALIGIIENKNTSTFLIDAEEVEDFEINLNGNALQFKINEDGFLLKKENETLKGLMSDLIKAIKALKFTTNNGPTIKLINIQQFIDLEERFNEFLNSD